MSLEAFSEKVRAAGIEVVIEQLAYARAFWARVRRLPDGPVTEITVPAIEVMFGRMTMDETLEVVARQAVGALLYWERKTIRAEKTEDDDAWFLAQLGIEA